MIIVVQGRCDAVLLTRRACVNHIKLVPVFTNVLQGVGLVELVSTVVRLRLDIHAYFNNGGDWEEEDNGIELIWRTIDGDETAINVRSPGDLDDVVHDMDGNPIPLDTWLHFNGQVNSVKTGRPVLRIENDNNADLIMVDMIEVKGF